MSKLTGQVYEVHVEGWDLQLPIMNVKPGLSIAVLNLLTMDVDVVKDLAYAGYVKQEKDFDTIVVPELKAVPLAFMVAGYFNSFENHVVVLRKCAKPYMGENPISAVVDTYTTNINQKLYLDRYDEQFLSGKRVLFIDDVLSTGSTLRAAKEIVEKAGGQIVEAFVVATEGCSYLTLDVPIVKLFELPLITS